MPTPGLPELLDHAQRSIAPEMWQAARSQQVEPRNVSQLLWAHATARYERPVIGLVSGASNVLADQLRDAGEQRPSPQAVGNALWALPYLGCRVGSQPDLAPLLESVVHYVQQGGLQEGNPQAWPNLLSSLAKYGCRLGSAKSKRAEGGGAVVDV